MPIFLTQQQVYRIIQRELPDGVYPDGPATAFYSTADSDATASIVGDAYANQEAVYDNYFPNYCDDSAQPLFEELYLGQQLSSSDTLANRQAKVIAKIRSQRRTTATDILATVYTVVDPSVQVEIVPWGCGCAGWVLDVSTLDYSTILNQFNNLILVGPDLCSKGAADYGLTDAEYAEYQKEAYFYEVRIYGYTLTAQESSDLETALLAAEPARSQHQVIDGLDPADMILMENC
jgi:hypothetical protein